jgi:hypothetical protein
MSLSAGAGAGVGAGAEAGAGAASGIANMFAGFEDVVAAALAPGKFDVNCIAKLLPAAPQFEGDEWTSQIRTILKDSRVKNDDKIGTDGKEKMHLEKAYPGAVALFL